MKKIARFLRKVADLVDPKVGPSDVLTIIVTCDTTDAEEKLDKIAAKIEQTAKRLDETTGRTL